ncbi:MAG: CapA family protein [Stomatobaculum sp.]
MKKYCLFRSVPLLLSTALLLSACGTAFLSSAESSVMADASAGTEISAAPDAFSASENPTDANSSAGLDISAASEPASSTEKAGSARPEIVVDAPVLRDAPPSAAPEAEAAGGPAETDAAHSQIENPENVRLAFCGDILLSEHVLNAYDRAGGVSGILDPRLLAAGREADLFIANEEFPFGTTGTPAPDKQFTFRVSPERCGIFTELGIDLVTLANNHTLDYGRDCLQETFETLNRHEIDYIGAGADISRASEFKIYTIRGLRIGFLAASRVIPDYSWNASTSQSGLFTTYDPAALLQQIAALEKQCDFTVVYIHWGLERHTEPEAYQTELAMQYIDAGADLVVGAHPHVLQPIRFYHGVPVVYSLGNYLFGSSIPQTELLLVELSPDKQLTLSVIPAAGSAGKTISVGDAEIIRSEE